MAVKDLIVRIMVDDSDVEKFQKSGGKAVEFGNVVNKSAMIATGALVALGAGAAVAFESLARIEAINAQTAAAIQSTGGAANVTASHVEMLAGELEGLTATEAETIQEGANLLLTFTNIQNRVGEGNDIFDQATSIMVDYARATGTDATSAALMLGKALNDPEQGLTALGRAGVQFSEDQKVAIQTMLEANDVAGAQKIILAELENQFGGSGAAYAGTVAGQMDLMGHKFGEVAESITVSLMPAIEGVLAVGMGFANWATENSQVLTMLVGAVAAISAGVLVLAAGMKVWAAVQAVQTAMQWANNAAWLASPVTWIILAIIVAIGLLVAAAIWLYDNWDAVTKWVGEAWENVSAWFISVGEGIVNWWNDLWAGLAGWVLDTFGPLVLWVHERFQMMQLGLRIVGDAIANWWNGLWSGIGSFFAGIWSGLQDIVRGAWNGIVGWIEGGVNNAINLINGIIRGVNNVGGAIGIKLNLIPNVSIPRLYAGGITTGPTLAMIGDNPSGREAVVPLDSPSARQLLGGGDKPVDLAEGTIDKLARAMASYVRVQERQGVV